MTTNNKATTGATSENGATKKVSKEIRTCITCGDKFVDRNTGLADHSQCYDCELCDKRFEDEED
jgi:hypothetical protein